MQTQGWDADHDAEGAHERRQRFVSTKRTFKGSGGQISAVEVRPESSVLVPEVAADPMPETNGTFTSNNADKPRAGSGTMPNGFASGQMNSGGGSEADAAGSPDGSLFGENDHGSLFGEDNAGTGGNAFGEEDDELTAALANGLQEPDAPGEEDTEMGGMGAGGPVQPPAASDDQAKNQDSGPLPDGDAQAPVQTDGEMQQPLSNEAENANGLPVSDEPLTAPPTNTSTHATSTNNPADLPPQSESTFLSAAIDGSLRIWDRRMPLPIATLPPSGNTPPWCTSACWSPDGNTFYAGRRNNTVDEYSIHHLGSKKNGEPSRQFKFQAGSGPVYSVRAMPNSRHLVCASQDILRIYDLQHSTEGSKRSTVPFTIVPGHRGGVISSVYVDPACQFMLSAAGNRGWEGGGTEVLLGYEIGVLDEAGRDARERRHRCRFTELFSLFNVVSTPPSIQPGLNPPLATNMANNDDPVTAFKLGLSRLLKNGSLTDMTIICGAYTHQVHKVILCAHSDYFAALPNFAVSTLRPTFPSWPAATDQRQEGETNTIHFKAIDDDDDDEACDDPEAIRLMIHYFYHLDYTAPIASITSPSSTPGNRSPSKVAPTPKEPESRASATLSHIESLPTHPNDDDLLMHAKVFAAAVKYQVAALRKLATKKFTDSLQRNLGHGSFTEVICAEVIRVVYTTTPEDVRALRDVVDIALEVLPHTFLNSGAIMQVLREYKEVAFDLFCRWRGLGSFKRKEFIS
ncbi:hypothetical protein D0859_12773 [Hortaea werneckii]|uniref:BTB domain-containing protein n=1 Tax=Hortaea werneckii TaxID=91943 RepID=A0A3M7ICW4_HORWE|nr:hypothetical protein D0859_12773 [Hortaea werneckii]